ncbi:adenosylcobinamide kinase /adenosylcobinamide-phosphate guanylyltransferase [Haloactinopolyspora alba]|uniref:Aminotransferase n=1 Tax=Haloactinopolyspora alba TaxID=648780 RepID=A0A2P8E6R3_9ACTN|nr:Rv2231c family pyridoxal phosphate-dependent protein CobC [Haloactinopolyspora alba]PSL05156.1 adenosylcobinamide kinase /adenosylcobinamide-phosphate guanylyltransferase [Haloactinopolyspora alba]
MSDAQTRPWPGSGSDGRLTVLLGGQKSGKSGIAARRAEASGRPVVVVTPAVVRDAEFEARVARHRADRPPHWRTLETFDLAAAVDEADPGAFVLVDALDTWLAESLESIGLPIGDEVPEPGHRAATERRLVAELHAFTDAVRTGDREVVVIAGQPGLGPHAVGAGARAYVDLHGVCLQALSSAADDVRLVMAGRTVPLEREPGREPGREPERDPAAGAGDVPPGLREHGDTQVPDGAVDLAVNVLPGPPAWLADRLAQATSDLAGYPDDGPARAAAARRHGRAPGECLLVDGAAEAFWLIAQVLRPRLAACVHPSFTEPEAALRANGVPVVHVQRSAARNWLLDPADVPEAADLVVLGRPDNPTGALDPVETVERLARPGRTVLVDEAFAEFLDDADGFAARGDLPGVLSVRSLTKIWGLAGLRVGYVLGAEASIARLAAGRQPWSCNNLALTAVEALAGAEDERVERAREVARGRRELVDEISAIPGYEVWDAAANFVLVRGSEPGLRDRLLEHGLAARRADTFPGLDDRSVRVAVRDRETHRRLGAALRTIGERSAP